ncbi:DUF4159 domain-containing protein [bacterium]|nr:DUF4159 domain-containing protein [bacterium]
MILGPFLFLQPWALAGLAALPILWLLLRATPPEPQRRALPSLALMDDLNPTEETPARTPWWLLLLRLLALALAIIGFAQPTAAPRGGAPVAGAGSLIVLDDGWTSAERWRDMVRAALAAVDEEASRGGAVHILTTAPREIASDPAEALDAETARQKLRAARPVAWAPDRLAAIERANAISPRPGRVVWISDGFDHGSAQEAGRRMTTIAPTEARVFRPKGAFALTSADSSAEGARVAVVRATPTASSNADLIAETSEGASIASTRITFEADETTAEALFSIPTAALNRVARFRIAGSNSAGGVWLWDDAARRPHVGLADTRDEAQPLLSEHYYVRKALQPYVQLTEKPLSEIITPSIDAIILGDRGAISESDAVDLDAWIEAGGVLIRFAGPRLAGLGDSLTPVLLRPTSRAMGGALAWETPQKIAAFEPASPFFGIPTPTDAVVRRQVLAQPIPELADLTWARLADGTPLVTAKGRGLGQIILFHVTADPDWSDLPYTGAFVEMLRRAVVSGGQRAKPSETASGSLTPLRVLDGFGALTAPNASAAPIDAEAFATVTPGPASPPGLYSGAGGERALNVGAPAPQPLFNLASDIVVTEDAPTTARRGIGGWLIAAALAIVAFDLLIALAFAGKLPRLSRAGAVAAAFATAALVSTDPASAQDRADDIAGELHLAYVQTGDTRLDNVTRAGLAGLSYQLAERTSVEPGDPIGVDLVNDELELFPLIYYAVPRGAEPLPPAAVAKVNAYLRSGGALIIDTRDASPGRDMSTDLGTLLSGIDAPPLQPTPPTHVLTRTYYLLTSFPGRLNGRLWVESGTADRDTRRGDGVSGLFIGGGDWAGAWAVDARKQPLFTMPGGERNREMAYRFGINLVMYVLTGNYKEDQVHYSTLLERLGKEKVQPRAPIDTNRGPRASEGE